MGDYLNGDRLSAEMPVQPINSRYRMPNHLRQGKLCFSCAWPAPQPLHAPRPRQNSPQKARETLTWDHELKSKGRETPGTSLSVSVQGCRKRVPTRYLQKILSTISASHSRFFLLCHTDCDLHGMLWFSPLTFPWGSDGLSLKFVELTE